MDNSVLDGRASVDSNRAPIPNFYTSKAWIDGRAEPQLHQIAAWSGVVKIAALPDLHPGKYGPVRCCGFGGGNYVCEVQSGSRGFGPAISRGVHHAGIAGPEGQSSAAQSNLAAHTKAVRRAALNRGQPLRVLQGSHFKEVAFR